MDAGKADIGFGNSTSTVEGLAGRAPFPKVLTNVCNLATIIWSSITASIGVILFAAGLHGYLLTASRYWHSIGLAVAGVLLIEPGLKTDLIGAAIAVVIIILQLLTAAAWNRCPGRPPSLRSPVAVHPSAAVGLNGSAPEASSIRSFPREGIAIILQ